MLVNLNDVLVPARKGKYAVGLFNTVNLELARGVMEAAEELDSPVIIGTAEVLLPYGPLEDLANLLIPMAERASVPVVVHLDHGLREETCRLALELGFSSIMYDCSTMDYGDNMEHVKRMAETAHSFGASIEAELGHGTAHGAYKLPPKLDFDRISEIAETISTPLVLHGGSGLSDSDFRTAVERGISKVNIFTDINQAGARAAGSGYREGIGLTDMILPEIEAVKRSVMEKMRLFGSAGQGSGR